jgi:hypothetical protein
VSDEKDFYYSDVNEQKGAIARLLECTKWWPSTREHKVLKGLLAERARLRAELAAMRDATAWIPCFERLPEPGQPVLVAIGKSVLRAMHAPHLTLSEDDWGEFEPHADYDEVTDRTYWPEGWYESDQHEERQFRLEREPTHWMPLPQLPRDKEGGGA